MQTERAQEGSYGPAWAWSLGALLLGLSLSLFAAWLHQAAMARSGRVVNDRIAERSFDAVEAQLRVCGLLVRSVQGLFLASEEVNPEEFASFYDALRPRDLFPSLQAIAYADRRPDATGDRFVTSMVAPLRGNERVLDLDVASQPANLRGLFASRDSNQPALSAAFTLVQRHGMGGSSDGVTIRLPAYTPGAPPATLAERRLRFMGSVAISFRVGDLIGSALPLDTLESMDVRVIDVTDGAHRLLYESRAKRAAAGPGGGLESERFRRDLRFGGRAWRMELTAVPGSRDLLWPPLLSFAGGVLASVLLALLMWSITNTRARAVVLARRMSAQYGESEARFRALNELLPTLVLLARADGKLVHANQAARERLALLDPGECEQFLHDIFDDPAGGTALGTAIEAGEAIRNVSIHCHGRAYTPFWATLSVSPIELAGRPHLLAVATDITELRELNQLLSYQASHDPLTGLYNRREFGRRINHAIAAVDAGGAGSALLYFDLDQFKIINDTSGHQAGDTLLTQLAALLGSHLVDGETIARLGGDEFGILLSPASRERAIEFAEKMRLEADGFVFSAEQRTYAVSVSVGLVMIDRPGLTQREILSLADTACYMAKERGRNRVHLYSEKDTETSLRRSELEWASRLRQALIDQRFVLHYQELRPLATDAADEGLHVEMLIRLRGEDGRMVPPGAFIPAAERFGLMPQLDRWVLEATLVNFSRLHRSGAPVQLCAINLSGLTVEDDSFADFVLARLQRHGVSPERICFEVTETAAVSSMVRALELMTRLRAAGCKFSLDDFGAGMASFGYLKNLPLDYLKIDGSFIRNLESDAVSQAIVRACTDIGHKLGLKVVAEWVGDEHVVELLRQIGVDYGQGYYLHRPEPAGGHS